MSQNFTETVTDTEQFLAREKEMQSWLTAPRLSSSIQVSEKRIKEVKEIVDNNLYTIISAPPQSSKTIFMREFQEYLVQEKEQVVTLNMTFRNWLNWEKENDAFDDYVNYWCRKSWQDILQCKSRRIYILLDMVEVLFKGPGSFSLILDRLSEGGNENTRMLMFAEYIDVEEVPLTVKICGEEETRKLLDNKLNVSITEHQLDAMHKFTAGHPKVLSDLIEAQWLRKFYETHNNLVKFMVSWTVRNIVQDLPQLRYIEHYSEEERDFLKKMILEMNPEGLFSLDIATPEMATLKNRGTIIECQGGVQFSAPIFRMAVAHSIFPGSATGLTPCDYYGVHYDFNNFLMYCISQLSPEQLLRYFKAAQPPTERARHELLVDLYAIISTVGDDLYEASVLPFVGSTFGSVGYNLDIQIHWREIWAVDIVPNDRARTPPHILGFINGGVKSSPVEQWALMNFSLAAPVTSEIEDNHWYICCTPDCTSGKLARRGLKDVDMTFRTHEIS